MDFIRFDDIKNSFSEPNVNRHFVVSIRFYLMQVHVSVHHDILIFNPIYISG